MSVLDGSYSYWKKEIFGSLPSTFCHCLASGREMERELHFWGPFCQGGKIREKKKRKWRWGKRESESHES
ncbi:unnamed protein product [Linum trigynum]|uniref:Uncharacterized protein n=1 Tax=Linum trigynum TaxID=586398 RepID=A0AAV2D6T2_9ROSI